MLEDMSIEKQLNAVGLMNEFIRLITFMKEKLLSKLVSKITRMKAP